MSNISRISALAIAAIIKMAGAGSLDTLFIHGSLDSGAWHMTQSSVYSKTSAESGSGGSDIFEVGSSFC